MIFVLGWPEACVWVHDIQFLHASHRSCHQFCLQDLLHVSRHGTLNSVNLYYLHLSVWTIFCYYLWVFFTMQLFLYPFSAHWVVRVPYHHKNGSKENKYTGLEQYHLQNVTFMNSVWIAVLNYWFISNLWVSFYHRFFCSLRLCVCHNKVRTEKPLFYYCCYSYIDIV